MHNRPLVLSELFLLNKISLLRLALNGAHFGLAALIILSWQGIDVAMAEEDFAPRVTVGGSLGSRYYGETWLAWPIAQKQDALVYADLRGSLFEGGASEGNAGLVWRFLNNDFVAGFYGYLDLRRSENDFPYRQVAMGADLLAENWEGRVNLYLPFGDRENVIPNTARAVAQGGGAHMIVFHASETVGLVARNNIFENYGLAESKIVEIEGSRDFRFLNNTLIAWHHAMVHGLRLKSTLGGEVSHNRIIMFESAAGHIPGFFPHSTAIGFSNNGSGYETVVSGVGNVWAGSGTSVGCSLFAGPTRIRGSIELLIERPTMRLTDVTLRHQSPVIRDFTLAETGNRIACGNYP